MTHAIASTSFHGWPWGSAALAATPLGIRLRRAFRLDDAGAPRLLTLTSPRGARRARIARHPRGISPGEMAHLMLGLAIGVILLSALVWATEE